MTRHPTYDVVLIGGGIMSATLGALVARLQPDGSIAMFERLDELACESSGSWNNAGTGHAGFCELNYMPDPADPDRALQMARQFRLSREFWASYAAGAATQTPHLDVVFGERDTAYLRQRFATLCALPEFATMQYSEDPAMIAKWAPLVMAGRDPAETVAATRVESGTDIDFAALTDELTRSMSRAGGAVRLRHEVRSLSRAADGTWTVAGRCPDGNFSVRARFVFVGAGGNALRLLQKAGVPEVRGYGVFPLGAQFFRTDDPDVVARHDAKVYSQAELGAPPMSLPHLDRRVIGGRASLMFGPYATFSTKLLKRGRPTDLFTTITWRNAVVLIAAGVQNLGLVRYLIGQLLSTRRRKFGALQRMYPQARRSDWHLVQAGQRAQLIKPDARRIGVLTFGTELVTSADGTIAGLLGASPGASIAPAIMVDLLGRCFPEHMDRWRPELDRFTATA